MPDIQSKKKTKKKIKTDERKEQRNEIGKSKLGVGALCSARKRLHPMSNEENFKGIRAFFMINLFKDRLNK